MNNKNAINALLEYRFQTKLLADLLEENGYFDVHVPESQSLKIFENTVQQATLICENQLHVPKNLLKKRILNEQVPPGRLARALEWTKAARMAREFEAEQAAKKAAEAQAALEAQAKKATEIQEIPIPIAGVTKGITPSQQEGLGKATAELLSGEALKRAQAKRYSSPEELAKELRDEMTARFLQAGQESDPRLIELQKRMGGYIDVISPAAIETANTMQWGMVPPEGTLEGIGILLEPTPGQRIENSKRDLAYEVMLGRQERADLQKQIEQEKKDAQTILSRAYQVYGLEGEPVQKTDIYGETKRNYTTSEKISPEDLDTRLKIQAEHGKPKTKSWLEDIEAALNALRDEYSRRKMEAKITTPEERAESEKLRQQAKTEVKKALTPKLPETSELIAPPPLTPEQLQREFLRTVIPPGSIVR